MHTQLCSLAGLLLIVGATTIGCAESTHVSEADTGPCTPHCAVGECGQDGCGGYCEPCAALMDSGVHVSVNGLRNPWKVLSTFCDEDTRQCRLLESDCEDGWCRVPAGSFIMGPKAAFPLWLEVNPDYPSPKPVYEQPAVLTRSFWISQTEVTQRQWLEVMETDQNPSPFAACGLDCPVSGITLFGILEFANRLSRKNGLKPCYQLDGCTAGGAADGLECEKALFVGPDCTGYRLPSEAELELAIGAAADSNGEADVVGCSVAGWCMANSEVEYPGCEMVDVSEFDRPNGHWPEPDMRCLGPQRVGLKDANRLGLLDGVGNICEVTGTLELTWEDSSFRDDERRRLVDPGFHRVLWGSDGGDASYLVVLKGGGYRSKYVSHAWTHGFTYTRNGVSQRGGGFRLARTAKD